MGNLGFPIAKIIGRGVAHNRFAISDLVITESFSLNKAKITSSWERYQRCLLIEADTAVAIFEKYDAAMFNRGKSQ